MPTEDRERWDKRHETHHEEVEPARFLREVFRMGAWNITPGRALDIATGKGRNAVFLAERGFAVDAIDISEVALQAARDTAKEKGLAIKFEQVDLNKIELPHAAYDLIINFNFLERSLIPKMKKALKLGGHVVFETYLVDQRVLGHPKNPAYLLGHNELLELFRDFRVLYYREGRFSEDGREAYKAGLFGQKVR
ncbi:MAG TPA: methyltransferase domain-containing protein [Candidatus Binatia bacterium]|jgi:2-polyprenyl-3-methyl-5-hydroxy-6-metoxy-1,4-benzoquinol methylase|nr:methyltransferase domain-containing protein [Candidatus Binatia bacterium]